MSDAFDFLESREKIVDRLTGDCDLCVDFSSARVGAVENADEFVPALDKVLGVFKGCCLEGGNSGLFEFKLVPRLLWVT